jgi:hypothetical protein
VHHFVFNLFCLVQSKRGGFGTWTKVPPFFFFLVSGFLDALSCPTLSSVSLVAALCSPLAPARAHPLNVCSHKTQRCRSSNPRQSYPRDLPDLPSKAALSTTLSPSSANTPAEHCSRQHRRQGNQQSARSNATLCNFPGVIPGILRHRFQPLAAGSSFQAKSDPTTSRFRPCLRTKNAIGTITSYTHPHTPDRTVDPLRSSISFSASACAATFPCFAHARQLGSSSSVLCTRIRGACPVEGGSKNARGSPYDTQTTTPRHLVSLPLSPASSSS